MKSQREENVFGAQRAKLPWPPWISYAKEALKKERNLQRERERVKETAERKKENKERRRGEENSPWRWRPQGRASDLD